MQRVLGFGFRSMSSHISQGSSYASHRFLSFPRSCYHSLLPPLSIFSFKHGLGTGNSEVPFDALIACGFFLYFVITASPPSMRLLLPLDSCSFRGLLLNCEEGGCGWERASCDLSGAPSAAEVGLKEIKFSYAVQCAISSSSTFYAFHLRSILFLHYHPFFSSNRR